MKSYPIKYMGILICQYKDPYKPIRISHGMSAWWVVVHVAHLEALLAAAFLGPSNLPTKKGPFTPINSKGHFQEGMVLVVHS